MNTYPTSHFGRGTLCQLKKKTWGNCHSVGFAVCRAGETGWETKAKWEATGVSLIVLPLDYNPMPTLPGCQISTEKKNHLLTGGGGESRLPPKKIGKKLDFASKKNSETFRIWSNLENPCPTFRRFGPRSAGEVLGFRATGGRSGERSHYSSLEQF